MSTFFLAIAIVTLLIAIQKVLNKKSRDFQPSMKIEQITEEEFRHQQKHLTRQEVMKLKNNEQYKQLENLKGKALEEWNW